MKSNPKPKFEEDKGVTRASRMKFNRVAVESLIKEASIEIKKRGKPVKMTLLDIEKLLGIEISNSDNFAWAFNSKNKHAPLADIAQKYKVKVGAHLGKKKDKKLMSNYFMDIKKE